MTILNAFQPPQEQPKQFVMMVDHRRLNPNRVHPSYLVDLNSFKIHDLFGNPIPYPGIQLGDLNVPYVSHCWQCGTIISSSFCKRSKKDWNFGFECPHCGEDLEKYLKGNTQRALLRLVK